MNKFTFKKQIELKHVINVQGYRYYIRYCFRVFYGDEIL